MSYADAITLELAVDHYLGFRANVFSAESEVRSPDWDNVLLLCRWPRSLYNEGHLPADDRAITLLTLQYLLQVLTAIQSV